MSNPALTFFKPAFFNSFCSKENKLKFLDSIKRNVKKIGKSFLSSLGLNTNIDPRTIKVYGNGGRMLPLANDEFYPIDLTENAIRDQFGLTVFRVC